MAVGQLGGVGRIAGEVKTRTLTVEYDASAVRIEAIQAAMRGAGYDSTILDDGLASPPDA